MESLSNDQQSKSKPDPHSVTSVAFLNDMVFASAGASDGTIKLWDLRKIFVKVQISIFTHGIFPS
jgi:WD40 repeat protein